MSPQEFAAFFTGSQPQADLDSSLRTLGFKNPQAAQNSLRRIMAAVGRNEQFSQLAAHIFSALDGVGDPDRVLATFERFLHNAGDALDVIPFLAEQPRAVEMLVRLFSGSQFLSEILLRNPEYFRRIVDLRHLAQPKRREPLLAEARAATAPGMTPADQMDALRAFQRWELLRIGVCDLLDLFDLPAATMQLSILADCMIQVCLEIAAAQSGQSLKGFVVIGMGKLGGSELNYSSDIDILFLAAEPSPAVTRVGERLIDFLARVTTEGFLYRVDMRLRPWGKIGPLISSPDGFLAYLRKHALLWEKQALLKARVVAGDNATGAEFLRRAHPLLFESAAETVRADVYAMRQRTEAFLRQNGRDRGNIKLGEGSIRDIEFVVQFLQLAHGGSRPEILSPNTLDSLVRCEKSGLLTVAEMRILTDGYIFLRTVEHHLQMLDYRQTHSLPDDPEALISLAHRLGFEGVRAGDQFMLRYHQHAAAIRAVYLRHVGRIEMDEQSQSPSSGPSPLETTTSQEVDSHKARMSSSYAERFSDAEIARHAALVGLLGRDTLVQVEGLPREDGSWEVTVVAFDFPGELSLICGLMFVYGLDILAGDVFTYEPVNGLQKHSQGEEPDTRKKIVDVFTVRSVRGDPPELETWHRYAEELKSLLEMARAGQRREARGALARRVGAVLFATHQAQPAQAADTLFPIDIEIDNESSDRYTALRITTRDTAGFLYEIANALAAHRIDIAQVRVESRGSHVHDILYVTDEQGRKITHPDRQRELRAAAVLIKHFTHLLPYSPNPESALMHFPEFIAQLFQRPNWPDELSSLERPEVLQAMARLLGVSDFLWDDFLRMQYENLYPVVTDVAALESAKTREDLQAELEDILARTHAGPEAPREGAPWMEALNAFKDREMFRIDMRHILGHTTEFWDFAAELTDLAEVVVNAAYHLCHEDLRTVYGTPRLENGEVSEMTVCALGKCGGRELGFASDIELMFLYAGNGKTTGPQVISTAEFYEKLVQNFVRAIRARREGVFEIDLQLRPYGKAGSLAVSLESFRRYYAPDGPAWAYERQALTRLRPVAGNPGLGERVSGLRDAYVYTGESFDVTAMRAMRERQIRHLVGGGAFNLKYSLGGLVDLEYLVQAIQITHGQANPALRQPNTREAMLALAKAGLLSAGDYTRLRKAHTFLRWMIDSLRVVRGNAKDVTIPPDGSEEFEFLARRMGYTGDKALLNAELIRYTADVQEINRRLLA